MRFCLAERKKFRWCQELLYQLASSYVVHALFSLKYKHIRFWLIFISDLLKILTGKVPENSVLPWVTFFVSHNAWVGEGYPTVVLIIIGIFEILFQSYILLGQGFSTWTRQVCIILGGSFFGVPYCLRTIIIFLSLPIALAIVVKLLEHRPAYQSVSGSILSQG